MFNAADWRIIHSEHAGDGIITLNSEEDSLGVTPTRQALTEKEIEQLSINTIRTLAMDAVQHANSGHPGTPIAMAPVAYCLW